VVWVFFGVADGAEVVMLELLRYDFLSEMIEASERNACWRMPDKRFQPLTVHVFARVCIDGLRQRYIANARPLEKTGKAVVNDVGDFGLAEQLWTHHFKHFHGWFVVF